MSIPDIWLRHRSPCPVQRIRFESSLTGRSNGLARGSTSDVCRCALFGNNGSHVTSQRCREEVTAVEALAGAGAVVVVVVIGAARTEILPDLYLIWSKMG